MFTPVFIVYILFVYAHAEVLHEYMTEPELAYIFNSRNKASVPEYEIVYLPAIKVQEAVGETEQDSDIKYGFSAFGSFIDLNLRPNKNLIPESFTAYVWDDAHYPTEIKHPVNQCHYLHRSENSVAAISVCQPDALQGLIFLDNSTLEVHPVPRRLRNKLKYAEPLLERANIGDNVSDKYPHIVRRAFLNSDVLHTDAFPVTDNLRYLPKVYSKRLNAKAAASGKRAGTMTAEVALFFDEAGYNTFAPYLNYDDRKLRDMLLAYLNGVQALYHHPSLGRNLELALVRLDIMKKQPNAMPHYEGERSKLLDSFCSYQKSINPKGDVDPQHWDMALYVSGLDFFAYEKGSKSGVTMGLATVGGVCLDKYNCIIAELGTTNIYGKPYPSAGFNSVYILAHEIGHNLGMHHDSSGNNCPKEGYIMSPSRGTNGETQWSTCSAEIMAEMSWAKCLNDSPKRGDKELDHSRFLDIPGQSYTAKKQCEVLLRDRDAVILPSQKINTICHNLQCKTPHRSGFYFAGPALEGTECGKKKYCFGGDCVSRVLPKPVKIVAGGWGPWKEGNCNSGCIENSQGHRNRQRFCNNPVPVNTDEGCVGSSYQVSLCDDQTVCSGRKVSAVQYASTKCAEFSKLLPELDTSGVGLQASHEEGRLWMGCAIFCKRSDNGIFFTPRIELNDLGVSAYFPDGIWCHKADSINYYCLQHHCLPENFQLTKGKSFLNGIRDEDISIPQNAFPIDTLSPQLQSYLSLGPDGKPLQNYLKPTDIKPPREEDWETKDYLELPEFGAEESEVQRDESLEQILDFLE